MRSMADRAMKLRSLNMAQYWTPALRWLTPSGNASVPTSSPSSVNRVMRRSSFM